MKVLVVNNSKCFTAFVNQKIETTLDLKVITISSFKAAVALVEKSPDFFIAVAGLYLHDANEGEMVDYLLEKKIPVIVFTGKYDDATRDKILSRKVIDYVLKEDTHSIDYLITLIQRIQRNRNIKILVVDDSWAVRKLITGLLEVHQYQVLNADSGQKAMKVIKKNPDIKMMITDYNMPDMNGFDLTREVRRSYSKEELAIIGISAQGCNKLSARFIKNGANDFMTKPFLTEEFYCRVTQNIDIIEYINVIKDASNRDYLTGLYNRRYFFETGEKLYAHAQRNALTIVTAMLDIDFFKKINDSYGHQAGDLVLKRLALILQKRFRTTDIVARFGGEEFCIMVSNMKKKSTFKVFDALRQTIENTRINFEKQDIRISVSIGVCTLVGASLTEMVNKSDELLYQAKHGGRNQVCLVPQESSL